MKTTIIRTDIWQDDELYALHLDSKLLYLYILSNPERGNARIFKWSKRNASNNTGLTERQIETAMDELKETKFVDTYNGYISILKEHFSVTKNRFSEEQEAKELSQMPEDVYAYFIDKKPIPYKPKDKKKPKEIKVNELEMFIARQPEPIQRALADFVQDRIDRKKPPTVGAVRLWVSKLNKLYPNNYSMQVASLEQSIERGWTGLFEVKQEVSKQDRAFL